MKLFCKHEFIYYNKSPEFWENLGRSHINACYHFVCKHCGKKKYLNQTEIKSELERQKDEIKYREALGKPVPNYQEMTYVTVPYYGQKESFRGKHVHAMLRYYALKGFDLTTIEVGRDLD